MIIITNCKSCKVAKYCPSKGASPLDHKGVSLGCRIIGGYGRVPVDERILSEESKILTKKNGNCLTIAEIPKIVNDSVAYEVTKIFSPPVKHERETSTFIPGLITPKSYK